MIMWVLHGECEKLEDVPEGAVIHSFHGEECIGICESCGKPVLEKQKYFFDDECVVWHKECGV